MIQQQKIKQDDGIGNLVIPLYIPTIMATPEIERYKGNGKCKLLMEFYYNWIFIFI